MNNRRATHRSCDLTHCFSSCPIMAFPFEVCSICFEKHGKNEAKVESLLKSNCLERPNRHTSVSVRVRRVDGVLEPQVRPMPRVYFTGHFVNCDPNRCRGERCTFPHCFKEKAAWNAQKFGLNLNSSAEEGAADSHPQSTQAGATVAGDQPSRSSTSEVAQKDTWPDFPGFGALSTSELPPSRHWTSSGWPISRSPSNSSVWKLQPSPGERPPEQSPETPHLEPVQALHPLLPRQVLPQRMAPQPILPLEPRQILPLPPQHPHIIPHATLQHMAPQPIFQPMPTHLAPLPLQASSQPLPNPVPPRLATLPQQILLPRQELPAALAVLPESPHLKQSPPKIQSRPSLFDQPLEVSNYHLRFRELLKAEEQAHSHLLKNRCDGKYTLCLLKAGQTPEEVKIDVKPYHHLIGYIKEMGCDEVSYATQSATNAVIEVGEYLAVQCDILQENMWHAEERLYVGFQKEVLPMLFPKLKDSSTLTEPLPVHFRLKFSYFRSLKESIRSLKKGVISRILPSSASFIPTGAFDSATLAPFEKCCSSDQFEALSVVASAPASGPPVIIAGPFGTGKTRVLAIAAHCFFQESVSKKKRLAILVCTQQHTSADAYLAMYNELTIQEEDITIFRLVLKHTPRKSKYTKTVDKFKEDMGRNSFRSLQRYLIITTCLTAKRIADILPSWFFTHIFLDEGAQMREPEAVAPLSMATPSTKLVIAGDRYQVGPAMLVLGEEPQKYGLSVSLLERLYDHYQELGEVARPYCAHLSTNFRCHSAILQLAQQVAYKSPLTCAVPDHSAHPDSTFPLRFMCTSLDNNVRETKESICKIEVDAALKEASHFILTWPVHFWGDIDLKKVCFLSPCRGQVTVARNERKKDLSPQVKHIQKLPTYQIQGQEFRALFISTSEPTMPDGATRDSTKSISDPAVFITALTRARSLVVAAGNPFMLLRREEHMVRKYGDRGHCWSLFLKACIDNGTLSVYGGESESSHAKLEVLKVSVNQRVQERKEIVPCINILPETPTKPMESPAAAAEQSPEKETSTEFKGFKGHLYKWKLGKGGFGVVCCVEHKVDKKEYALKIVRLCDRSAEEKVTREVVALARLEHDNIVRYYDSWKETAPPNWQYTSPWKYLPSNGSVSYPSERLTGETESQAEAPDASATTSPHVSSHSSGPAKSEDSYVTFEGTLSERHKALESNEQRSLRVVRDDPQPPPVCLCIKTELCDRETLKTWLNNNRNNRKRKEVTAWFEEILHGVEYIHSQGLIHRDLKPSNIFFSLETTGSGRKIKIGDFGLVTSSQVGLGEAISSRSNYVGTWYYISPEQDRQEQYGKEVDIYALGITFFEMNCPFHTEMERHKVLTDLRNKGSFPKRFSDCLEAKIMKLMLTEDPSERPSASDIIANPTMKKLSKNARKSKATIFQL